MWNEVAISLQQGNVYIHAMLLLSFFATLIVVERFIMLNYAYNLNFKKFITNVRKALSAEDFDRAKAICKSASKTSFPQITLKAIDAASRDINSIKGVIEEETLDFLPRIESRLMALPAVATAMLFLGILGTIDGLWTTFNSVDVLDTFKKQATIAHGISGSLNPTAIGLFMCMFVLFLHQYLKSKALELTEKIHYGITVLTNVLVPNQPMAAFAPMAPAPFNAGAGANQEVGESAFEETSGDDAFDSSEVEDIKDEEEII